MKLNKLVGFIAVSALFLGACEEEAATKDTEEPKTESKSTEEVAEKEENSENIVEYEVIEDSDASFGDSTRHSYWIYPENGEMTEKEFIATSEEFIEGVKKDYDFSAVSLFYIDDPENPVSYQIGMAEYAPNGDWSAADTVDDGDYSSHEFKFDYIK